MANLTLVIDDQLLQAARIKALQQGTSVNEICREAIARFARPDEEVEARLASLRKLADKVSLRTGSEPLWPGREALYDEVLRERRLLGKPAHLPVDRAAEPAPKPRRAKR